MMSVSHAAREGVLRRVRPQTRLAVLLSHVRYVVGQVLLLGVLFMIYRAGRFLANGREAEALSNARDIRTLQRLLDLPDESVVQGLALHSTNLIEFANGFYIGAHFPVSIAFLFWVMVRHRDTWPRVRTVIMASTGAALMIHILYPLAPPRFLPQTMPEVSFVDTGTVYGPSAYPPGDTIANQYAAMPSLHVGWSILVAWGVVTILRVRARWLVVVHPVLTTLVVVVTANHYWLDGIIGGGLVAIVVHLTRPEAEVCLRLWTISSTARMRGREPAPAAATGPPVRAALDVRGQWLPDGPAHSALGVQPLGVPREDTGDHDGVVGRSAAGPARLATVPDEAGRIPEQLDGSAAAANLKSVP